MSGLKCPQCQGCFEIPNAIGTHASTTIKSRTSCMPLIVECCQQRPIQYLNNTPRYPNNGVALPMETGSKLKSKCTTLQIIFTFSFFLPYVFLLRIDMVCEVHVVTLLNHTPIFERYMERLVVQNRHQKDICHSLIKPCVHNTYTILSRILALSAWGMDSSYHVQTNVSVRRGIT